jgi:hypothetical protein
MPSRSRLPDSFQRGKVIREVTLTPQNDPNSAAFLSQTEISSIRNESERFFTTHFNILVNQMIEKLLTIQSKSGQSIRISSGQMKIFAIQYCSTVQRAVGDLAGRLGRAIGERHGLGNQPNDWILNLTGMFASEKTSEREVSLLFQYLKNRFAIRNEKNALRVLQGNVALLAHRRTLGEPDEAVETKWELLKTLERFSMTDKLPPRKRRVLFLRAYDLQSSARAKLQYLEARYGNTEKRIERLIPHKKRGRRTKAEDDKMEVQIGRAIEEQIPIFKDIMQKKETLLRNIRRSQLQCADALRLFGYSREQSEAASMSKDAMIAARWFIAATWKKEYETVVQYHKRYRRSLAEPKVPTSPEPK